jgi:hypothetical protein
LCPVDETDWLVEQKQKKQKQTSKSELSWCRLCCCHNNMEEDHARVVQVLGLWMTQFQPLGCRRLGHCVFGPLHGSEYQNTNNTHITNDNMVQFTIEAGGSGIVLVHAVSVNAHNTTVKELK